MSSSCHQPTKTEAQTCHTWSAFQELQRWATRCTSRPKVLGSGVEARIRFLGSGNRTRSLVKPVAVIQEIDWVGDNVTRVVAPRNCQTLPHCDSLTTANQAVVSILLFDGYFQHHFPDMDVLVRVCLLLKYTCTAHGPTSDCTSNPDVHMKTSLHTHIDRSIRVDKSQYFHTYVSYTHVWIFSFAYFQILLLNVYLFIFVYLCMHVCMYALQVHTYK